MATLKKEVREFVDKVEPIGWTFTGEVDGEGHPIMRHKSGAITSIPATPSDWRGFKNALSQMERISGEKIDRSGKRRKSHKKFDGSGFSMEDAKREQAMFHATTDVLPVADLWSQRRTLIAEMVDLLKCHTDAVDQTDQAATLLWKIRASERALKQLGQSVREFDLMDLPLPGHVKEAAKTRLKATPKPDPKIAKVTAAATRTATKRKAIPDDFDGTLLIGDTEPWEVDLMGKTYALYLTGPNRAMIETFLTDLVDGAKVVRKKKPPARPRDAAKREQIRREKLREAANAGPAVPEGDDSRAVRKWLRENGFPDVKDRGRFSAAQVAAWNNRNKRARRLAKSA